MRDQIEVAAITFLVSGSIMAIVGGFFRFFPLILTGGIFIIAGFAFGKD